MPRIAVLDKDKCSKQECGYVCIKACPGVRMGDETILKDNDGFPVISELLCTGCGICPKKCPNSAIKIINLPEEKGTLVIQFGVNSFRLFNQALPREGAVVGLIGANGIGKTTTLKILSGQLVPNVGKYKEKFSFESIIQSFKGVPEIQNYYRKLANGLKVSFKPQTVDNVPKLFKGKASALLKKMDERKKFNEAVKLFDLENFLDSDVADLSGGELQRVSICAAWLKEADFYFFDEPSSYLDIEQRLNVARLIKGLAAGGKFVVVVEHDLAVLDYLCDYVHVFYGVNGAYGVASGLKGVRNGVNEYLQGFLKDENTRFRENDIKFEVRAASDEKKSSTAYSYPELTKKYSRFSLECDAGAIRVGEVVGIIGPNAIGKSTFVKMLAGVEAPSSGKVEQKMKVSYKPQYVKSDFDGTVAELVSSSKVNLGVMEDLKKRLSVGELLDKSVKHLSGGELQRVSIALSLSQDADVYLFDEPSAFLDVEQRLQFAHILKQRIESSEKTCFVVDHDIVLVDSVSDRLMVFEGESSKRGKANAPASKRDGMNAFLKRMNVTMRRDKDTGRPRVNKAGSQLDEEQKQAGEYFYHER